MERIYEILIFPQSFYSVETLGGGCVFSFKNNFQVIVSRYKEDWVNDPDHV